MLLNHSIYHENTGIQYFSMSWNGNTCQYNIPTIEGRNIVRGMIPCAYRITVGRDIVYDKLIFCNSKEDFKKIISDWDSHDMHIDYTLLENDVEYEIDLKGYVTWRIK